jgi:hypothetical protein
LQQGELGWIETADSKIVPVSGLNEFNEFASILIHEISIQTMILGADISHC